MGKKAFIGTGTARKVKKIYLGVGNKAHKVKKGFIGVAGKAHQFFSSGAEPGLYYDHPTTAYVEGSIQSSAPWWLHKADESSGAEVFKVSQNVTGYGCCGTQERMHFSKNMELSEVDPNTFVFLRSATTNSRFYVGNQTQVVGKLSGGTSNVVVLNPETYAQLSATSSYDNFWFGTYIGNRYVGSNASSSSTSGTSNEKDASTVAVIRSFKNVSPYYGTPKMDSSSSIIYSTQNSYTTGEGTRKAVTRHDYNTIAFIDSITVSSSVNLSWVYPVVVK